MAAVQRAQRQATRVFGALMIVLGITIVVLTVAQGQGPFQLGTLVGAAFALLGAGRLYLLREP
ncbi:MAG: hypothetical protein QOJ07_2832 [Thermoleophilaceae bacterium]|jgi:multisubunit Na+/H+ antiporter MnhG subunit|nr:hypothetical protein [Thermoleophilaceae bacterium]